jgi:hypothetical protein
MGCDWRQQHGSFRFEQPPNQQRHSTTETYQSHYGDSYAENRCAAEIPFIDHDRAALVTIKDSANNGLPIGHRLKNIGRLEGA